MGFGRHPPISPRNPDLAKTSENMQSQRGRKISLLNILCVWGGVLPEEDFPQICDRVGGGGGGG